MGGEDFSQFTRAGIRSFYYHLGSAAPEDYAESQKPLGKALASTHSPFYAPVPEPTLRTGVLTMSMAILELMHEKKRGEVRSCQALAKSLFQPLAVQVAADENELVVALLSLGPGAVGPAVEEHVDPLKHESPRIALDAQHPLHAENVRPFLHQQLAQPLVEFALIEVAGDGDADGKDIFVVFVFMGVERRGNGD